MEKAISFAKVYLDGVERGLGKVAKKFDFEFGLEVKELLVFVLD